MAEGVLDPVAGEEPRAGRGAEDVAAARGVDGVDLGGGNEGGADRAVGRSGGQAVGGPDREVVRWMNDSQTIGRPDLLTARPPDRLTA
jgi:hypothetical protein